MKVDNLYYCDRCGKPIQSGILCEDCDKYLEEHYRNGGGQDEIYTYANGLIDGLIYIKDRHRDVLLRAEIDNINNACNLIEHNIDVLKRI